MSKYYEEFLTESQQKQVKEIFKGLEFDEEYGHHSGGGNYHDIFLTKAGTIYVHIDTEQVEKSYRQWDSIESYVDPIEEIGFGWEFNRPDYDKRCWDLEEKENKAPERTK